MPPSANVQTTTNQYLAPAVVDQILHDNRFLGEVMKDVKKWRGSQYLQAMKYQKGEATVSFAGFDELPINQIPTRVNMLFYPSWTATNVALAGTDISVNQADGNNLIQVMKLLEIEAKSRAQDAADSLGTFLQGDGTGNGGKDPMGLAGIVDDGSTLSQYGGLSRSTYSGLNASSVAATSNKIDLVTLRTLWNDISDGSVVPNFAITSYEVWGYIEAIMTTSQRNMLTEWEASTLMNPKSASVSGYADLVWDGMKIIRDRKTASGVLYMLNMDYLNFLGLKWYEGKTVSLMTTDIEGNVYEDKMYNTGDAFSWTGFIRAYNGAAINGYLISGGQLVGIDPWRNGKITGITGY